jgi:hypothetical protein
VPDQVSTLWPPSPRARQRRHRAVLGVAIVCVLVASVAAAVARQADDDGAAVAGPTTTARVAGDDPATSTTGGDAGASPSATDTTAAGGDGAPDDGSAGEGGTGDDGSGDDDGTPSPAPVVGVPPTSGLYRYTVTNREADGSSEQYALDLTVSTDSRSGDTVEQTHSSDAFGVVVTDHVAWNGGGVVVRSTQTSGAEPCTYEPALVDLVFPLAVGASWVSDAQCTATTDDGPSTTTWHQESSVTGISQVAVGGRTVDVYVIERTRTVRRDDPRPDLSGTFSAVVREEFAAAHGLFVRTTIEQGSASDRVVTERVLTSLTPA